MSEFILTGFADEIDMDLQVQLDVLKNSVLILLRCVESTVRV